MGAQAGRVTHRERLKPYGGPNAAKVPAAIQEKLFPGAKGCYVSRIADAGLK